MEEGTVQAFFDRLEERQRTIALVLHEVIMGADPEVKTTIRYRIPFYDNKTWFCYLNPQKGGSVELCFLNAKQLDDPAGILDFRGRKMVAGLICDDIDAVPFEALERVVQQAIAVTG